LFAGHSGYMSQSIRRIGRHVRCKAPDACARRTVTHTSTIKRIKEGRGQIYLLTISGHVNK
jgi:hypothetical protein